MKHHLPPWTQRRWEGAEVPWQMKRTAVSSPVHVGEPWLFNVSVSLDGFPLPGLNIHAAVMCCFFVCLFHVEIFGPITRLWTLTVRNMSPIFISPLYFLGERIMILKWTLDWLLIIFRMKGTLLILRGVISEADTEIQKNFWSGSQKHWGDLPPSYFGPRVELGDPVWY